MALGETEHLLSVDSVIWSQLFAVVKTLGFKLLVLGIPKMSRFEIVNDAR